MGAFKELISRTYPTKRQVVGACLFIAQQVMTPEQDKLTYNKQCKYLVDRFNASPYWLQMSAYTEYERIGEAIEAGDISAGLDLIGNYMQSEGVARSMYNSYMSHNDTFSIFEYLRKNISEDLQPSNVKQYTQVDLDNMYGTEGMNPVPDYSNLKSL